MYENYIGSKAVHMYDNVFYGKDGANTNEWQKCPNNTCTFRYCINTLTITAVLFKSLYVIQGYIQVTFIGTWSSRNKQRGDFKMNQIKNS